jgi:hypothetical protein
MEELPSGKCVNEDGAGCFPAGSGEVDLHGAINGPCGGGVSQVERDGEGFSGGVGVVFSGMVLGGDGWMRRLGLRRLGQVVPATLGLGTVPNNKALTKNHKDHQDSGRVAGGAAASFPVPGVLNRGSERWFRCRLSPYDLEAKGMNARHRQRPARRERRERISWRWW